MATQTINITGSGFGSHAPYNGDSYYIQITDVTKNWNAGYCDPTLNPPGNPNSCLPLVGVSPSDAIGLNIASWTDTNIQITGFTASYGQNNWTLDSGDQVQVEVWNAQTSAGPASYTTTVTTPVPPSPTCPNGATDQLVLDRTSGPPSTPVIVRGCGFPPGWQLLLDWGSDVTTGFYTNFASVTVAADGTFGAPYTYTVPGNAPVGQSTFDARPPDNSPMATADFTVMPGGGGNTGGQPGGATTSCPGIYFIGVAGSGELTKTYNKDKSVRYDPAWWSYMGQEVYGTYQTISDQLYGRYDVKPQYIQYPADSTSELLPTRNDFSSMSDWIKGKLLENWMSRHL